MPSLVNAVLVSAAAAAALAACDGGGLPEPEPEPPVLGEVVGEVLVLESVAADDGIPGHDGPQGQVEGNFHSGTLPIWQKEAMNDGTCRLLKWKPARCDEACWGACTATNVCEHYPSFVTVGRLDVTGLSQGSVTLEQPPGFGGRYQFPGERPPAELFSDDATIGVSGSGSTDVPALAAQTRAVPKLEVAIENFEITLWPGQDHIITWTPAFNAGARVRLVISSSNDSHGLPFNAIIECDVPDDAGQIRVPAAMVDAFPETWNWGNTSSGREYPISWIRRYRRTDARVAHGTVRLEVGSEVRFGVVHKL